MENDFFTRPFSLGNKQVQGRFVIPSGIRCTHASTIAKTFAEVAPIGVVTTKSISFAPRAGYREPIYARYAEGCYINAVGLANPGAKKFLAEFDNIEIPSNKFLLVSIFGGGLEEFLAAAETLSPIADGFELNMSCPHAKGYGLQIGEDVELVTAITRAVAAVKPVPVFVKLAAMMRGLPETAQASMRAGAAGITVTNSIGPAMADVGEKPILYNRVGGLSGDGIRPLGLRSVQQVRDAIGPDPIVIGMGGIGTAEHIAQYRKAGANLFGVGSTLTGMDSAAMRTYFERLQDESQRELAPGEATSFPSITDMSYTASTLVSRDNISEGLYEIRLDTLGREYAPGELAGRYFFLCVPGVGEKPFAILSAAAKTILIRTVGTFTAFLEKAPLGTRILLRGPYGAPLPRFENRNLVLVGGGTGTASLLEIAYANRYANDVRFLLGARTRDGFFDLDDFREVGDVLLATDDGSEGYHGTVSDLLRHVMEAEAGWSRDRLEFVNCGPDGMVHSCIAIQREVAEPEHIWGSIEYMTSCGVGICGKCASPSGSLTCIDGPFVLCDEFTPRCGSAGCCHETRTA
ncbi:MAG TPA: hypothetical protein VLE22_18760 [Bryobacteraceae bacterium]|nr:hypothetical protein [Bryobacteraceae bacterium]